MFIRFSRKSRSFQQVARKHHIEIHILRDSEDTPKHTRTRARTHTHTHTHTHSLIRERIATASSLAQIMRGRRGNGERHARTHTHARTQSELYSSLSEPAS